MLTIELSIVESRAQAIDKLQVKWLNVLVTIFIPYSTLPLSLATLLNRPSCPTIALLSPYYRNLR